MLPPPPVSTLFPYTTLFRSADGRRRSGRPPPALARRAGDRQDDRRPRSEPGVGGLVPAQRDRKSTRLNSSHPSISYAVFCLKKKKTAQQALRDHIRHDRSVR